MPMPLAIASRGERNSTPSAPTRTWPSSGRYSPARMFISVLLPAPFSPRSAWISPGRTSKSTPSLARTPGKVFEIQTASMAGGRVAAAGGSDAGSGLTSSGVSAGGWGAAGAGAAGSGRPSSGVSAGGRRRQETDATPATSDLRQGGQLDGDAV